MPGILEFEVNQRLRDVLAKVLGLRASELKDDMSKDEVASWDSLRQMDLVMSLEREYDIELELADILRMTSIATIAAVLADKGIDVAD
jgi:acyl carrier protein